MSDFVCVSENRVYLGLLAVAVGCLFSLLGVAVLFGEVLAMLFLGCGLGLVASGLFDLWHSLNWRSLFQTFRRDERALGWQLMVFVAGVIAFPVAWFAAGWATEMVFSIMGSFYTFTGFTGMVVMFTRGVIMLIVGLCLFSLIMWLWVNSNRRQELQF